MRPKSSRKAKDGTMRYSYVCETKEKSRGALCQMPNILGRQLDDLIVEDVLELREQIVTDAGQILQMPKERFMRLSAVKQKMILKKVVKEIIWDGENAEVHFLAEDFSEVKSA